MRAIALTMMLVFAVGCSSGESTTSPPPGTDAADADTTIADSGAGDSSGDVPVTDSGTPDAPAETKADTTGDGGGCAAAASTEACILCCRQTDPPNYGGFELYAYEVCSACPVCSGFSPCGTNTTPPAKKDCVGCLQGKITASGLPSTCSADTKCKAFAACMQSCPLK